ncbi:MAG: DUF3014 domain-containing protein [Elusimicrobia bacterium]|nr:DUF3014 domain-containing protein [Elusimicrobiota bacterium]
MANTKALWASIIVGFGAAAGLALRMRQIPTHSPLVIPEPPPATENARPQAREPYAPPTLTFDQGDERIRQSAREISPLQKLGDWLKIQDLIRRAAAAVNNIAEGASPRNSLDFLAPKKPFSIRRQGQGLYVNPRSYARYDAAAEAFSSLNAEAAVRILGELHPLFQGACRELGCRDADFKQTLVRAIQELLKTPIIEGPIPVQAMEKGICYSILPRPDGSFERLSEAQKHLLRMGPMNAAKVQAKLRELARALGVPEEQIPKPGSV